MKQSGTCPKCSGREFLVVQSNEVLLYVMLQKIGRTERWICRACGYVETWADDVERAFAAGGALGSNARIVRPDGGMTAYR